MSSLIYVTGELTALYDAVMNLFLWHKRHNVHDFLFDLWHGEPAKNLQQSLNKPWKLFERGVRDDCVQTVLSASMRQGASSAAWLKLKR